MKKIFILLLLISQITVAQPKLINLTQKYNTVYNILLDSVLHDLKLDTCNIEILICNYEFNNHLLYIEDSYASLTKLNDKSYVINIMNLPKTGTAIYFLHELVHLSHIINKEMKVMRGCVWYKGNIILNSIPYEERQYEIDAINISNSFYKKYKHLL